MAFLLPNLQPYFQTQSKSKDKPFHQTLSQPKNTSHFLISSTSLDSSSPLATLQTSTSQVNTPLSVQDKHEEQLPKDEFYVNLGLAVRTLREDMPMIFIKDLNYDIYRYFLTPFDIFFSFFFLKVKSLFFLF
jgi:hypothetical protein